MKIEVNIPDDELMQMIKEDVAKSLHATYSIDRSLYKRMIAEAVRSVIYADKDYVVEMIVSRAARECGNKAVKKLLEGMTDGQ